MEKVIRKMEADIPSLPLRKRVAAYARVSSGKDAMLRSLSAQVSYYIEHIQSHPEWEYAGVYVDEALTGTKDDRDGFQRLLADCRAGKIDMVLTKSISRFARNTVTLLETVRELKNTGRGRLLRGTEHPLPERRRRADADHPRVVCAGREPLGVREL